MPWASLESIRNDALVEAFCIFVHWILVGIAIGIGLMIAPLVVRLGIWLLVTLVPVALVLGAGYIVYIYWNDIVELFLIVGLLIAPPGGLACWLYLYVPASRNDKLWHRLYWGIALFAAVGAVVAYIRTPVGYDPLGPHGGPMILVGGYAMWWGLAAHIGRKLARDHLEKKQSSAYDAYDDPVDAYDDPANTASEIGRLVVEESLRIPPPKPQ